MDYASVLEFDDFKLDCGRFELRRSGQTIKLERKPMELLILLAGRNGHLVTRSEIAARLWEPGVFVDTEHGINTAIGKIRHALRDDPEKPRFVLTITGKGYRFIGNAKEDYNLSPQDGSSICREGYIRASEISPVRIARVVPLDARNFVCMKTLEPGFLNSRPLVGKRKRCSGPW